jgi:hypothetical protein
MIVATQLIINWDLKSIVQKLNFRFIWNVQNAVQTSFNFVWGILGNLSKDITFNWNLERVNVLLRQCRYYIYPCTERVADCVSACPAPTRQVTKFFTFKWNLGLVIKPLNLLWDLNKVIIEVTSPLILKWNAGIEPFCSIDLDDYIYSQEAIYTPALWGMDWSPDGKHLIIGLGIHRQILAFNNSSGTPWDIVTARAGAISRTYPDAISPGSGTRQDCVGIQWAPDGLSFYATHSQAESNGVLVHWLLPGDPYIIGTDSGSPGTNQPTIGFSRSMSDNGVGATLMGNFRISPDGLKLLGMVNDSAGSVVEYEFSTAWDISTMSLVSANVANPGAGQTSRLFVSPDGNCIYVVNGTNSDVEQWLLTDPWTAVLQNPGTGPDQIKDLVSQFTDPVGGLWLNEEHLYTTKLLSNPTNCPILQWDR